MLERPLLVVARLLGRFKLEDFTAVDEVWLIDEAVLELSEGRRFLRRRLLLLGLHIRIS